MKQAFLSYAREDREKADRLYQYLTTKGVDVWMDSHCLSVGDDWDRAIKQEIVRSTVFLACISDTSIKKTGNVQVELQRALKHQKKVPSELNYILPVMLDNCEIPPEIEKFHCISLDSSADYEKIYQSVEKCFDLKEEYGGGRSKLNVLMHSLHEAPVSIPPLNVEKKISSSPQGFLAFFIEVQALPNHLIAVKMTNSKKVIRCLLLNAQRPSSALLRQKRGLLVTSSRGMVKLLMKVIQYFFTTSKKIENQENLIYQKKSNNCLQRENLSHYRFTVDPKTGTKARR